MTPEELAAKLRTHPFSEVSGDLLDKVAKIALSKALPLTRLKTGRLRTSETTNVEIGAMRAFVSSDLFYAPFVEARFPFFEPAAELARPEAEKLLRDIGVEYFSVIVG